MSAKVSIIMPVYNGEKYLREAINSILTQTYSNFEFIIVDDGSSDRSAEIIRSYSDKRIRFIENKKNLGLDTTLNNTFKKAHGTYIARMDCDDISFPQRIEKQVEFMEAHKEYGMCGTQYVHLNQDRIPVEIGAQLLNDDEIKLAIQSVNCFCHGSVMFRNSFVKEHNIQYLHLPYEDYELWTRVAMLTRVHNLSDVLYGYLDNPKGLYLTQYKQMIEGPRALGKKLQKKMHLPRITIKFLTQLVTGSKKYRIETITIGKVPLKSNFMLAYQTFLYKLGLVYLKRGQIGGVLLLGISFALQPANWFRKMITNIFHKK